MVIDLQYVIVRICSDFSNRGPTISVHVQRVLCITAIRDWTMVQALGLLY